MSTTATAIFKPPRIRYVHATGQTIEQMRQHVHSTELYKIGDCTLVWVNEGDFWSNGPQDLGTIDRERAEYERLKAKFEASAS